MATEVSTGRRAITIILCFIECLIFGGNMSSWSILVYVLKQDGIFASECQESNPLDNSTSSSPNSQDYETSSSTVTADWILTNHTLGYSPGSSSSTTWLEQVNGLICPGQDSHLSLAFTMGLVADGILSIPLGWLQDRHGLRITRVFASVFAISGYMLLGFAAPGDLSWLVYPGCICMALSCHIIIMTNCHICGLAGRHASKLVSLYNGGVNAGVSFLVIKLAAEAGVPRLHGMSILTATWGLVLFTTFVLLPSRHVINDYNKETELENEVGQCLKDNPIKQTTWKSDDKLDISKVESCPKEVQLLSATSLMEMDRGIPNVGYTQDMAINHCPDVKNKCQMSRGHTHDTDQGSLSTIASPQKDTDASPQKGLLKSSLLSVTYLLYLFWFSVLFLRISWFLNTYNTWLTLRVDGNKQKVSFYTNIFGYFKFGGILVAPLAGVYMDYRRRPHHAHTSGYVQKAIPALPSLVLTSLTSLMLSVSVLIPEETVIYITLVLAEIYRAFLFATAVALLESVFSPLVYGKLFGVQYTVGATINFLMYPMTSWTESTDQGFTHVNTLLVIAVGTTLIFPGQVAFSWVRLKRKKGQNMPAKNKI